jgi:hypothetical protein
MQRETTIRRQALALFHAGLSSNLIKLKNL